MPCIYQSQRCTAEQEDIFLNTLSSDPNQPPTEPVPLNGPVYIVCKILCTVMALVTEAEIGILFTNVHKGKEVYMALEEMVHPQPPMPKKTWAIDMQFYWVHNRIAQNHFVIYWHPGLENLGNYHTKHHSAVHHKHIQQYYLYQVEALAHYAMCMSPRDLRWCVESDSRQTQGLITQRGNQ
eukprot:13080585-Ditylum_brightwellii.AAC.1